MRHAVSHIVATFAPAETELSPALKSAVGRRGRFRAILGDQSGEPAMMPIETWLDFPFVSCPRSDLTDIERIDGAGIERRRTGRSRP
jgi:hypothetical protein